MAKNFCPNCGAKLEAGTRFCGSCGERIEEAAHPQRTPAPIAPPPTEERPAPVAPPIVTLPSQNTSTQMGVNNNQPNQNTFSNAANGFAAGAASAGEAVSDFASNAGNAASDFKGKMMQSEQVGWLKREIFTTEGRLNRWPYFLKSLGLGFGVGLFYLLTMVVAAILWPLALVPLAAELACVVGIYMVGARRCHDLDLSGVWLLLFLVPVVDFFFGLYLAFWKGTTGPNRYGSDPLEYQ